MILPLPAPRARLVALLVAAVICLAASRAAADPAPDDDAPAGTTYLHLVGGAHLTTPGGASLDVPPGYYLDDGSWQRLDGEVRRLQDVETRLTAENESFRESAKSWRPPWWAIAAAVASGVALGYEAKRLLRR